MSGGSSPQARGTPALNLVSINFHRFIPAGAGNTTDAGPRTALSPVHPRRRGEHIVRVITGFYVAGSSPQARGTPESMESDTGADRFIPAGAGNTATEVGATEVCAVHPRRRGEHPIRCCGIDTLLGSSPQARGTRLVARRGGAIYRFIPAGAGNTPFALTSAIAMAVHPRRRGEHSFSSLRCFRADGSSPQARGTRKNAHACL